MTSVKFKTYAQVVVRNALYSHCRAVAAIHKRTLSLDTPINGSSGDTFADTVAGDSGFDHSLSQADALNLLESVKSGYSGVALKGIEALELKIKGFSVSEIADIYGVKPTHVGA